MKQDSALTLLMIEGKRGDHLTFSDELQQKGYVVTTAPSGSAGLAFMDSLEPDVVIIDAASLRTSGLRICQSYRKADNDIPIVLIVNQKPSQPKDVDANLVLKLPFTVQKLINRIKVYQKTDDKFIRKMGPIILNTRTQLVSSYGQQTKLTPRLVRILELLIKHHGKVVERDWLFKKVWETEYTGDTRTLDVHISWLRQAIEEDHHNPKLIKTERGVGYQLDL